MEKVVKNALLTGAIGLSFLWAPAGRADGDCGPNGYVFSIEKTAEEEITTCQCSPGFSRQENACERTFPITLLKKTTPVSAVVLTQRKVDLADPGWVSEVQNRSRAAIRLRRSEIEAKTRSFKMKEPPPPQLPLSLSQVVAGDIILVGPDNSTLAGAALGFVQGFGEKWLFGNERGNVVHALVYMGEKSGVKMYLDNQPGSGPRVIDEALFKSIYGSRPLYAAQPTLQPAGRELYAAAWDYALANAEAKKRGLPGSNYGVFGKGNVVCSESALFAVVRAQAVKTGPGKIFTVDYVGGKKISPISITPGDIYNQDGKGYFTVRPMQIDGKS